MPVGIVGLIWAWNYPFWLCCNKISACLTAGNCCVAKPTEIAPTHAFILSEIIQEAGLPPGVVNIIHGLGKRAAEPMLKLSLFAVFSPCVWCPLCRVLVFSLLLFLGVECDSPWGVLLCMVPSACSLYSVLSWD